MSRPVRYQQSTRALSRAVGDEVLVCLPEWSEVDRISPSGAAIWRRLDAPRSLADVTADVAHAFAVKPADVRGDVRRFVTLLEKRGLVVRVPATGGNGAGTRERKEDV